MSDEYFIDLERANDLVDSMYAILRVSVRRPDDLFVADITFHNLRISGSPPVLKRIEAGHVTTVVIELPPQSFGEEVLLEAPGAEAPSGAAISPDSIPANGELRIRIARPSRLAFTMPANQTSVPYTLNGLLSAIKTWPLARALAAQPETQLIAGGLGRGGDALTGFVASENFLDTQRTIIEALRVLAPGAETAVAAAGKRIAKNTVATLESKRASSLLQTKVRTETTAVLKNYTALNDVKTEPLINMAIAFETAVEMSNLKIVETPGYKVQPEIDMAWALLAPIRPGSKVTALEIPYRLQISPIGPARFTHRATAAAQQGRTELWHTRLTNDAGNTGPDLPGKFRAIWSEDFLPENAPADMTKPFRMPLDAQDRKMLVQLMAGFNEFTDTTPPVRYTPRAAKANRLILSPLGAMFDATGTWTSRPKDADLDAWRHKMGLGRDHYVRVVYAGFLLPFGHSAALIKVGERKFAKTDNAYPLAKRAAVIGQRYFLAVRDPLKLFDGSYHETGGHPFPFTSVELLTQVTPNLVAPDRPVCKVNEAAAIYGASAQNGGLTPRQLFWPMVSESPRVDFRFDIAAIDRAGQRVTFSMPLLFMSEVANTGDVKVGTQQKSRMRMIVDAYNTQGNERRIAHIGGASVCFAPPAEARDGDPRLPTDWLKFKATPAVPIVTGRINTYPEVQQASVGLRAVQRILNKPAGMSTVRYPAAYRNGGFQVGNPGEVFLQLETSANVDFGPGTSASRTDAVGAVASPSMKIEGLSRHTGLVSDLTNVAANKFNPIEFFGDARILGAVKLSDIIKGTQSITGTKAPKFTSRELPASGSTPARTESRYDWTTQLENPSVSCPIMPSANGSTPSSFRMLAITTAPIDSPTASQSSATATIGNFNVNLLGLIILSFRELTFTAERGKKPIVNVDMDPKHAVRFSGALEFVNELKDLLPSTGFSDPSALQVTASGISAHYSLAIPSVQVGVFDVCGMSIGARFTLPFDNSPMEVGFNFGERENPFSMTVSLLGGGGFLAIGLGTDGIREVEAALEAGARCSIDLGVASGAVEIKAGIYFHWLAPDDDGEGSVELAGYVRLHGELDVMGMISASLTFNLQLGFKKEGNRSIIAGEATLTIEIEVLVFSGEVTVRCRREFSGSPADPTFLQLIPNTDTWSAYCSAFGEA